MGNWHISIRGVGSHHNQDNPKDANRMAKDFVKELRDAGHHIQGADFTHGANEDLDEKAHERGKMKVHIHTRRETVSLGVTAMTQRYLHRGWIIDGGPFVDEPLLLLKIADVGAFEGTVYLDPGRARALAAELLAAAEQAEQAPRPCPGDCGYGCAALITNAKGGA